MADKTEDNGGHNISAVVVSRVDGYLKKMDLHYKNHY